jgi:hypothetical protein
MTEILIDKKKYILIPEKDYKSLQKRAALKTRPERLLSIEEARAYSKKLINKWAAETNLQLKVLRLFPGLLNQRIDRYC